TLGRELGRPDDFKLAVREWRQAYRVPGQVYLSRDDERLLLDLDDPRSLDLLKRRLRGLDGHPASAWHYQKIEEVLPGFDGTWLRDGNGKSYFSELVIPLVPMKRPPAGHRAAGSPKRAHRKPGAESGAGSERA